jgi:hypothetical protein
MLCRLGTAADHTRQAIRAVLALHGRATQLIFTADDLGDDGSTVRRTTVAIRVEDLRTGKMLRDRLVQVGMEQGEARGSFETEFLSERQLSISSLPLVAFP